MSQTSDILQGMQVTSAFLEIKFKLTPKTSTLTNESFSLYSYVGTPAEPVENMEYADLVNHTEVPEAFESIILHQHYNSVARSLTLFFKEDLTLDSGWYILGIDGVDQASGTAFDPEAIIFSYNQGTVSDPPAGTTPTEFTIIDKSIKKQAFLSTQFTGGFDPGDAFRIVESTPAPFEIFVAEDHNNGVIEVEFSETPAASLITLQNFKVQQKDMTRVGRWMTLEGTLVELDAAQPIVRVQLPEFEENVYFRQGYKYRLIVSKNVGTAE